MSSGALAIRVMEGLVELTTWGKKTVDKNSLPRISMIFDQNLAESKQWHGGGNSHNICNLLIEIYNKANRVPSHTLVRK